MVAIPENVARFALNFALTGGEIAVTSFHAQVQHGAGNTLEWQSACDTAAKKCHDKWNTNMGPVKGLFGNAVALASVAVYHLEAASGKALEKGFYSPGAPVWKGAGINMPYEVSVGVTLLTSAAGTIVRNPGRRRGRMYLPPPATGIMASGSPEPRPGRLAANSQGELTTALGNFFNDIHHMSINESDNPLGGQDWWSFGVLSRADGQIHRVERVRVGDIPDAQRRRRQQIDEVYSEVAVSDG